MKLNYLYLVYEWAMENDDYDLATLLNQALMGNSNALEEVNKLFTSKK